MRQGIKRDAVIPKRRSKEEKKKERKEENSAFRPKKSSSRSSLSLCGFCFLKKKKVNWKSLLFKLSQSSFNESGVGPFVNEDFCAFQYCEARLVCQLLASFQDILEQV